MVGKIQNLSDSLFGQASNLGLNFKEQLGRGHGIRNSRVGLFQVQVQILCQMAETVFLQGWKKELGQLHRIHSWCVEVKTLKKEIFRQQIAIKFDIVGHKNSILD